MTTMKQSLTRPSSLPSLNPIRPTTPSKSNFSTVQPILPDILVQKRRSKKRVRFALKLDAIEEDPSSSSIHENSLISTTKPNKRIIDPWRENGPLYGAYVEYLEKQNAITPNTPEIIRPPSPQPVPEPEHELESSTYTHTFIIQSKSPELVIDSVTVGTPSLHLPRIVQRTTPPKNNRKQSLSNVDSYLKQRMNVATPPRKISGLVNNKNHLNSVHTNIKRADIALPSMRDLKSNEKNIRTNNHFGTKIVNDYYPPKKLTEIVTNPLPDINNQNNYSSNSSKTSQINSDQSYFFQNHNYDHVQPFIHSNR